MGTLVCCGQRHVRNGDATVWVTGSGGLALWYLESPSEEWVGEKDMSSMTTTEIRYQMPFHQLSNFEIETNFQSSKLKILDLIDNNRITEFLKENLLDDPFNPNDIKQCDYFDEKN